MKVGTPNAAGPHCHKAKKMINTTALHMRVCKALGEEEFMKE
jgi:hypothetical protein